MMTPMPVFTQMFPMGYDERFLMMITKNLCSDIKCARRDLNSGGMVGNHTS